MKWLSRICILAGCFLLAYFGYSLYDSINSNKATLEEVKAALEVQKESVIEDELFDIEEYQAKAGEGFGILTIPKLDRSIGIVEGADEDALKKGVGHVESTVFPGQNEQIVLSGHRDGVFRDFGELKKGDIFLVEMPYGEYQYEIRDYRIVDQYDTSIIGQMGEEVLVISTCYPFNYIGLAPERFVFFAYPID
ncbi:MAG TPA: class D sortase [Candidatus Merdenecus merdavium]|nr:class D sortase [Candidatus Merdenecus merdavium]